MKRRALLATGLAAASAYPLWRLVGTSRSNPAAIDAISIRGNDLTLPHKEVVELGRSIQGQIFLSGSDGYDTARTVRNRMIDKYPALVVQCTSADDVREAVSFAQHHELLTAIKCSGHNISGNGTCDGGLLIDLSPLQGVEVSVEQRTATVAGGSWLAALDEHSQAVGLVTTAGTVSHTGVGGLTLGGGIGRVGRRFGLTSDNLLGVDIVGADGQLRRASAEENPDLYWAVRGGGGNFGVVTSFDFQLHPLDRQVVGGEIYYPYEKARDLIKFYAEYCHEAPDDMYADLVIFAPPLGFERAVYLDVCYSGPLRDADRVLAPLRKVATPVRDEIQAVDYVALQKSSDDSDPRGTGQHLKSGFVRQIDAALVDALVDNLESNMLRGSMAFFQQMGGEISRIAPDATAFPHRYASHNLTVGSVWPDGVPLDAHTRWADFYWDKVKGFTDGFYTNDAYGVDAEQAEKNYRANLDRLVEAKTKFDPMNLFQINTNVKPTPA